MRQFLEQKQLDNLIAEYKGIYYQNETLWDSIEIIRNYENHSNGCGMGAILFSVWQEEQFKDFHQMNKNKYQEYFVFSSKATQNIFVIGNPDIGSDDLKNHLKMKYFDEINDVDYESISGEEWYLKKATKIINNTVNFILRYTKNNWLSIERK